LNKELADMPPAVDRSKTEASKVVFMIVVVAVRIIHGSYCTHWLIGNMRVQINGLQQITGGLETFVLRRLISML